MAMTSITSESQFEEYLKSSSDPVIVDFWAEWCGPCKMISPMLEKMSNNVKNVRFAKINVEQASDLAEEFGITGIPTLVLMKNNVEVKRIVGVVSESKLQSVISESFGS